MPALFEYRLCHLPEIIAGLESAGFDVKRYLAGWFWLSDGWYWLNTPAGRVPTAHPSFSARFPHAGEHGAQLRYPVARLWVNLQDTLAAARTPLQAPFSRWVSTGAWYRWEQDLIAWWRTLDDEDPHSSGETAEVLFTARRWWNARHLDLGYLTAAPAVRFWRIHNTLILKWDTRGCLVEGQPHWVETSGRQEFDLGSLEGEVEAFRDRLGAEMQDRLREVAALGLLETPQLTDLQRQHEATMGQEGRWDGDAWEDVRVAVAHLEALSGLRVE